MIDKQFFDGVFEPQSWVQTILLTANKVRINAKIGASLFEEYYEIRSFSFVTPDVKKTPVTKIKDLGPRWSKCLYQ